MSYRPMSAWLFGKLPAHGDFVSRGLTAQTRDVLDRWLSDEMAQARDRYGDTLPERFDAAPPLLFAHADADGWEGGTLCPSIDAVGRRFPLLVARKVDRAADAAPAARACIETVYHGYTANMNVDVLWDHAGAAPLAPLADEPAAGWWIDGAQIAEQVGTGRWPAGLLRRILEPANA